MLQDGSAAAAVKTEFTDPANADGTGGELADAAARAEVATGSVPECNGLGPGPLLKGSDAGSAASDAAPDAARPPAEAGSKPSTSDTGVSVRCSDLSLIHI